MKPSRDVPKRRPGSGSPLRSPQPPPWKRWTFRLAAILLSPIAFLLTLELVVRAVGFGYPTGFLLPWKQDGRNFLVQNNKFGWRFFGRQMARAPQTIFIPQIKPPGTIRVFVFGESAAFGDPQPAFGLPRMLRAMLELRHPGTKFEVVNAAMTGINSHTILPMARDCAGAAGDIWVLYMGNNEVVGPFGAGTVFSSQSLPLPVIRANLALKTWRAGQLLQSLGKHQQEDRDWGGMAMFLNQQVAADDPRLKAVYRNFEQNLRDILGLASRRGVGVVVSTVAVNLEDCAPFGSAHRADFSDTDLPTWQNLWDRGLQAQAAGDNQAALQAWLEAARLDDRHAQLRFALGSAANDLGQTNTAHSEYAAARDLDTLRFRCDSRLNQIIRRVAKETASSDIVLTDSEEIFAHACKSGSPGSELFYDHVHLTFEGNYLLAQGIARSAEKLLPNQLAPPAASDQSWPLLDDCARRLGWSDFYRREAGLEMMRRLSDPPFTAQLNHAAQLERYERQVTSLAKAATPDALALTFRQCAAAFVRYPEDGELALHVASLANAAGEPAQAMSAANQATKLIPNSPEAWSSLGASLEKQRQFEQSAAAYRQVVQLDPQAFYALNSLGRVLLELSRTNDAIAAYREAVEMKPLFSPGWLSLGELLAASGKTSEAQICISNALAHPIRSPTELKRLAVFCRDHGWALAAATNYAKAAMLDPTDIPARLQEGQCFEAAGHPPEAEKCYDDAVRAAPDSAPAHFLFGRALGQRGDAAGAETHFRAAVQLMPQLVEARLNLAMSLVKQGRQGDAITEYETVLERWPTNQVAMANLQRLRAGAARSP